MSEAWYRALPHGIRLTVQVIPNARKTEVAGVSDDALRIRLQAQPIEGQANQALIRYLADALGVPKSAVQIAHGHAGRRKRVEVGGCALGSGEIRQRLGLPA